MTSRAACSSRHDARGRPAGSGGTEAKVVLATASIDLDCLVFQVPPGAVEAPPGSDAAITWRLLEEAPGCTAYAAATVG
jgi:hypothetical protein